MLDGGAHLWRGKSEFSGSHIEYDSLKDIVKASKAETGEERVKVIIQPKTQENTRQGTEADLPEGERSP